jgi:predicted permease
MKFFGRPKFENDMDSELRFHIDAYTEDLIRSGFDRSEAERRARIEFGGREATKEECRGSWGFQFMDEVRSDLRYALRGVRNNPGFAVIAILTLALGIGANTAIFGVVDAVMLRIFPVHEPDRLVFVDNVGTQGRNNGPPYPFFEILRENVKGFEGVTAFSLSNVEVWIDGAREQTRGVWVSGNFYQLLGIKPVIGRTLSASDDQTVGKGGPEGPVAVISSAYWKERFGADPKVVGRAIRLYDSSVTIVGVMPSDVMSLAPGTPIDIAIPMMLSDPQRLRDRSSWWLNGVVARMRPGVTNAQIHAEADTLFQTYMKDVNLPQGIKKLAFDHIELFPAAGGMDRLRTTFAKPLTALLILAGLVLLAACVTVANLMLGRANARAREFAVRLAIGAGRGRLIRQTLAEVLVLVTAGSAIGIVLASQGEQAIASFFADSNDRIVLDLSLNGRVLLFAIGVSLLTVVASVLLPAWRVAHANPAGGLQNSSRTVTGSRATIRASRALVVIQVALSALLLGCAGLFIHSLHQLETVDPGFTREGILTMEVAPERALFGKPAWINLQGEILDSVRKIQGVISAGWSTMTPLSGRDRSILVDVPGFVPGTGTDRVIHLISVSPEYWGTLGTPVVAGRTFLARDGQDAPRVAMLNEAAAAFYFGKSNPIGRQIKFVNQPSNPPAYEVIGVVKDTKHQNLRDQPWRFVYLPIEQSVDRINRVALSVRYSPRAAAIPAQVTKEVKNANSTLLITNVSTMEQQVERSLITERSVSALSAAFGLLALVLACIGLYGVLAYSVSRRTTEIGIRMALGATRAGMIWSIVFESITLTIFGLVLAMPGQLALGHLSRSLLFGIQPLDVAALGVVFLILFMVALIAGLGPGLRAGRLHPMSALRTD